MDFEVFPHQADVGIRGFGETLEEAFENGAKALFSLMAEASKVKPKKEVSIQAQAEDKEALFVEWLNELLAEADLQDMVFSRFEVKIENNELQGKAWGEILDPKKHEIKIEPKGATYANLKVEKQRARWVAQCIVDV